MVVGEDRQPTLGPELGAAHHEGRGGGGRHHHQAGVGGADAPLQVDAAVHPGVVGQTLAGKLRTQVKECPARVLREVSFGSANVKY